MYRFFILLFIITIIIFGIFLIVSAVSKIFDDENSTRTKKKYISERKESSLKYRAQFDAITEKYNNSYSGEEKTIYKDAYVEKREDIIKEYAKNDARYIAKLKDSKQYEKGLNNLPLRGDRLTVPAEIELYQSYFVRLMSDSSSINPYEDGEYNVIDRDKFYKIF